MPHDFNLKKSSSTVLVSTNHKHHSCHDFVLKLPPFLSFDFLVLKNVVLTVFRVRSFPVTNQIIIERFFNFQNKRGPPILSILQNYQYTLKVKSIKYKK